MARTIPGTSRADDFDFSGESDDLNIFGFKGNDVLRSGSGNDLLVGGLGNDNLFGGDGNDTLWGGNGETERIDDADTGNDRLFGGAGHDKLFGQNGNDQLFGGEGDDTLNGGRGADSLKGGIGTDVLIGDEGADRFEFDGRSVDENGNLVRDSSLFLQTMDRVMDFVHSQDQIVFTGGMVGIENGNYIELDRPGADYSTILSVANDRMLETGMTYVFIADGTNGFLFADVNGDKHPDMGIMLMGVHNTSMFAAWDIGV